MNFTITVSTAEVNPKIWNRYGNLVFESVRLGLAIIALILSPDQG